VLKMTSGGAVVQNDGPAGGIIFLDVVGGLAERGHRLNTEGITGLQDVAMAAFAIIRDLGTLVHFFADEMADVIFDDAEMAVS